MIVKYVNKDDFIKEFKSFSESYANKFSVEGLEALYNYLDDLYCGENDMPYLDLDVIALCCDYTEYDNAIQCAENYKGYEWQKGDKEANETEALEWLRDNTQVIEVGNGKIIIENF